MNPYVGVGQVARDERFVGRTDLLRLIRESWSAARPANLSLQGNHRMGKTSLARRAQNLFATGSRDLVVVYLSVGTYESGSDVIRAMTRGARQEILLALADDLPKWVAELHDIELSVHDSTEWLDLKEGVETFFGVLHREGIRVAAILDEFDKAEESFQRVEFQLLRDLVSENYSVGMATLSRRSIKSIELAAVAHSTLDGVMGVRRSVGPFTEAELDELLARATAIGVPLDRLRAEIQRLCGNHPYLVELLCRELVETHRLGELDLTAAWEQVEAQFTDQFARSIGNLDADTGERGSDLLYQVLTRTHLTIERHDLLRLRRLGLIRSDGTAVSLFSVEFARHVRREALDGSIRGWWIDRDAALRAQVRQVLVRTWGAGWAEQLPEGRCGRWYAGLDDSAAGVGDHLDALDRFDAGELADLIVTRWPLFEPELCGDPAAWAARRDLLIIARKAAQSGLILNDGLRRQAQTVLDPPATGC
ncbi:ATP-binding protein [Micromonospora sp. C31]|uniref:ATP-binding protein n=1 Tax=Micromonospora sp. C31 TaxID=2824876 RepID=UPI001FFDE103|nr:ATP-binding protein [Micromonospora sp. C31]